MSEENPDELFCSAVAGDLEARERLMHSLPGYVFRKCNTGDKNAVVLLWRHFYAEAKRVVHCRTSSNLKHLIDASSILSDVNLSLLKRFENLSQSQIQQLQIQFDKPPRRPVDTYARLRAWYKTIVVNRLIDVIRRVKKIQYPRQFHPDRILILLTLNRGRRRGLCDRSTSSSAKMPSMSKRRSHRNFARSTSSG